MPVANLEPGCYDTYLERWSNEINMRLGYPPRCGELFASLMSLDGLPKCRETSRNSDLDQAVKGYLDTAGRSSTGHLLSWCSLPRPERPCDLRRKEQSKNKRGEEPRTSTCVGDISKGKAEASAGQKVEDQSGDSGKR